VNCGFFRNEVFWRRVYHQVNEDIIDLDLTRRLQAAFHRQPIFVLSITTISHWVALAAILRTPAALPALGSLVLMELVLQLLADRFACAHRTEAGQRTTAAVLYPQPYP